MAGPPVTVGAPLGLDGESALGGVAPRLGPALPQIGHTCAKSGAWACWSGGWGPDFKLDSASARDLGHDIQSLEKWSDSKLNSSWLPVTASQGPGPPRQPASFSMVTDSDSDSESAADCYSESGEVDSADSESGSERLPVNST